MASDGVIIGKAPHLAGNIVRVMSTTDPVSQQTTMHATDTIGEDGSFQLSVDLKTTAAFILSINRFTAPIYIEPGNTYHIDILPDERDILIDTWQRGLLNYTFKDLDSTDVNARIAAFESDYYRFFVDNEAILNSRSIHTKLKEFEQVQMERVAAGNAFEKTYVRYSVASMKLALGGKRIDLFEQYIKGQPLIIENPAWYGFFDQFYGQYFDSYDVQYGGAAIYNRLSLGMTGDGLDSLMRKDDFLQDDDVRTLVKLKSIAESLYDKKYNAEKLLPLLDEIADRSLEKWSEIATGIKKKYISVHAPFPAFELDLQFDPDAPWLGDDTLWTYVFATSSWSSEGARELSLLQTLKEKYPGVFHVVVVDLSGPSKPALEPQNWRVATPSDDHHYMQSLNVYSIPHSFWVNAQGEVVRGTDAPKPSEGLEKILYRLKSEMDAKKKIRVGQ